MHKLSWKASSTLSQTPISTLSILRILCYLSRWSPILSRSDGRVMSVILWRLRDPRRWLWVPSSSSWLSPPRRLTGLSSGGPGVLSETETRLGASAGQSGGCLSKHVKWTSCILYLETRSITNLKLLYNPFI